MPPSTPQPYRGKTRVKPPSQLTGHLGWICMILVLALAGAGINLYSYFNPAPPRIPDPSAIAQPADDKQTSPEINLNDPSRPELLPDDPGNRGREKEPAIAGSTAEETPLDSPLDERVDDKTIQTPPPASDGRRRALAKLAKVPAPTTAQPVTEKPSAPSLPVQDQARVTAAQAPEGPEPPEIVSPPNVKPPPAAPEPTPPGTAEPNAPGQAGKVVRPFPDLPDVAILLQGGDYRQAATQARQALQSAGDKFTISLEVACRPETLQRGLEQSNFHPACFLLPRKVKEQSCFALLWGLYPSASYARRTMETLPAYFKQQTPPPRVSALKSYLDETPPQATLP